MAVGQIAEQLGQHLEADQKAVQWVFIQFVGAREQLVEQCAFTLDVTLEQHAGELGLVFEVIKEAALGDADRGNQLFDRRRIEALGEHGRFCDIENALAGVALFPGRCSRSRHGELYLWSSNASNSADHDAQLYIRSRLNDWLLTQIQK